MINGNGLLAPCPNKVVAIVQLERPWDLNTLQQFLGAVNWFRRHISDHAEIQNPLNDLGQKWPSCFGSAAVGTKQEGKKALLFWVSSRRNKTGCPPVLGQQAAGSRAPQNRVAPQAPQN
jgi:hypothetical protein